MRLHYAGFQPDASGYGWATANSNLVRELRNRVEIIIPDTGITVLSAGNIFLSHVFHPGYADVVFMPLINHEFEPASSVVGRVNLAYTFFESPLGPNAAENAKKYNTVFCGSTWCLQRMQEAGITNGKVLIQGVDQSIFSSQPQRKRDGQFRIFSGGKFEHRKGQDLVIEAVRKFSLRREDALLVGAWFNPWPQLITGMPAGMNQLAYFEGIFKAEGIKKYHLLGPISQERLAHIMFNTDVGLFPNRCEGGTNLVLMEYASCGRKVIANARTGHADIAKAISYEIPASNDENHWAVQEVDDIVAMLELAYENRFTTEHYSLKPIRDQWTWGRAAETIIAEAKRFL